MMSLIINNDKAYPLEIFPLMFYREKPLYQLKMPNNMQRFF